jgi:hypothetical protein
MDTKEFPKVNSTHINGFLKTTENFDKICKKSSTLAVFRKPLIWELTVSGNFFAAALAVF